MAPESIFHHISFRSTILVSVLRSFAIFYFPFHKPKIPKILLYHLSISIRSQVANNREGIDNPLSRWLRSSYLFVQVQGTRAWSPTGLIPWFSKLREILMLLCCITLSSSREKPMQAQEVAPPNKRYRFMPLARHDNLNDAHKKDSNWNTKRESCNM